MLRFKSHTLTTAAIIRKAEVNLWGYIMYKCLYKGKWIKLLDTHESDKVFLVNSSAYETSLHFWEWNFKTKLCLIIMQNIVMCKNTNVDFISRCIYKQQPVKRLLQVSFSQNGVKRKLQSNHESANLPNVHTSPSHSCYFFLQSTWSLLCAQAVLNVCIKLLNNFLSMLKYFLFHFQKCD